MILTKEEIELAMIALSEFRGRNEAEAVKVRQLQTKLSIMHEVKTKVGGGE